MSPIAVELGTAYLSLSASTRDFAKDVKGALGDAEREAGDTGKRSGSLLGRGLSKGLKIGGTAIAATTALVAGLALKGGISRALAIEDAQAKLKGLGHDTKSVQNIMDSALASVKGTAFGLGDAASVAASVVAAGVQPGEDLTRTLKLVADASTIAGTSMSDMGLIFNKVASTGKIQGEVIAQLGERGIPILQLLANELGVSAAEVADLASKGKVDFATFQNAMEAGMGGAALESGNTFRGAMVNAMAALGRLGEKVVGGVLPQIKDGFGDAISVLDSWGPQAEEVGAVVGRALTQVIAAARVLFGFLTGTAIPALAAVIKWMNQNRGVVIALAAAISALVVVTQAHAAVLAVAAAGGIVKYIKGLQMVQSVAKVATAVQWAWNAALTANPIGLIIAAIAALVAGLVWFFTQTELGQKIWSTVWGGIKAAAAAVADWFTGTLVPGLQAAWDAVSSAAKGLWDGVVAVWDGIVGAVTSAVNAVVSVVTGIATFWRSVFDGFLSWINGVWTAFWGSSFGQLVKAALDLVGAVVLFGVAVVREAIADVVSWLTSTWGAVWGWVSSHVSAAWAVISGVVSAAVAAVRAVIASALGAIQSVWASVWGAVSGVVSAVWAAITAVITSRVNAARAVVTSVVNAIRAVVSSVFSAVGGVVSSTWDRVYTSIATPIQRAYDTVSGVVSRIKNLFSGAGSWLVSAGKSIIDGLISGITSKIKGVTDTLKGLTDKIPDWKGPAEVDRKLLVGNGQLIMGSLITGLRSGYGDVRRELQGITADLPSAVQVNSNLQPRGLAGDSQPTVAYFTDAQVERLALAFETGSVRGASGVLSADKRALAGTRQTRGAAW